MKRQDWEGFVRPARAQPAEGARTSHNGRMKYLKIGRRKWRVRDLTMGAPARPTVVGVRPTLKEAKSAAECYLAFPEMY